MYLEHTFLMQANSNKSEFAGRADRGMLCLIGIRNSNCICHLLFIRCPIVYFRWARGANARGTTQERGEALLRRLSPLSLRFSPSRSLSPYPLPSAALNLSAADSRGIGFRKAGDRGRKPKGIGRMRACEFPPVPLGCHPRSVGRNCT